MNATPAYDPIAALYDRAFADIRVREVEWRWIGAHLDQAKAKPRVLDVGSGNGALLKALAPRIAKGVGVDVSLPMIACAEERTKDVSELAFQRIDGSRLPFEAGSFDVVISFLSFRYLDWEAIWPEIRRVLADGGRFLLVDLVHRQTRFHELPRFAHSAVRHALAPARHPEFTRALRELTAHPDWAELLRRHPIRAFSAYERFFRVHSPGARFEALDLAPTRRIVALDSGPLHDA